MNRISALMKFQLKQIYRRKVLVFISVIMFPLIYISNISPQIGVVTPQKIILIKDLAVYFLLLQVIITALVNVPINEAKNLEMKVIKRLSVTPITKEVYLISGIISQGLISFIGSLLILVIAENYKAISLIEGIEYLGIYVLGYIMLYFLGFIIGHVFKELQTVKTIGTFCYIFSIISLNSHGAIPVFFNKITGIYYLKELFLFENISQDISLIFIIMGIYAIIAYKVFKWE